MAPPTHTEANMQPIRVHTLIQVRAHTQKEKRRRRRIKKIKTHNPRIPAAPVPRPASLRRSPRLP